MSGELDTRARRWRGYAVTFLLSMAVGAATSWLILQVTTP